MAKITLTIPDEHVDQVVESLRFLAGKRQAREYQGSHYQHPFKVPKKQQSESVVEFVRRYLYDSIRADCRLVRMNQRQQAYLDAINAVPKPVDDIGDDIVG